MQTSRDGPPLDLELSRVSDYGGGRHWRVARESSDTAAGGGGGAAFAGVPDDFDHRCDFAATAVVFELYFCVLLQHRGVHDEFLSQRRGFTCVRNFQGARVSKQPPRRRPARTPRLRHAPLTNHTRRFTQQADAFPVMRNLHSRGEDEDAVLYDGD